MQLREGGERTLVCGGERRTLPHLISHTSHYAFYGKTIGGLGERITQCGFGPCSFQKASGSLGAWCSKPGGHHDSNGGNETQRGCAEQYGRAPGLARYCWW